MNDKKKARTTYLLPFAVNQGEKNSAFEIKIFFLPFNDKSETFLNEMEDAYRVHSEFDNRKTLALPFTLLHIPKPQCCQPQKIEFRIHPLDFLQRSFNIEIQIPGHFRIEKVQQLRSGRGSKKNEG